MKSNVHLLLRLCGWLLFVGALSGTAFADAPRDRTQVGSNITIRPGEEAGDVTCFGCSIRVRGHVSSDATAFGGSVILEDEGEIDGDITTFGGSIRLGKEAKV
jgi:hypothetical protein